MISALVIAPLFVALVASLNVIVKVSPLDKIASKSFGSSATKEENSGSAANASDVRYGNSPKVRRIIVNPNIFDMENTFTKLFLFYGTCYLACSK